MPLPSASASGVGENNPSRRPAIARARLRTDTPATSRRRRDSHRLSRRCNPPGVGSLANATALRAPADDPITRSGAMPASTKPRIMPTWGALRLPPPWNTKATAPPPDVRRRAAPTLSGFISASARTSLSWRVEDLRSPTYSDPEASAASHYYDIGHIATRGPNAADTWAGPTALTLERDAIPNRMSSARRAVNRVLPRADEATLRGEMSTRRS